MKAFVSTIDIRPQSLRVTRCGLSSRASCSSSEQALAFLQSRLGGEDPDPPVPVYPYLSFEIPTNLSRAHPQHSELGIREGQFPRRLA